MTAAPPPGPGTSGPAVMGLQPTAIQVLNFIPAVAAILASGGVMMAGGYLFHNDGWGVAGFVMIPAGPLISVAFLLADRVGNPDRRPATKMAKRFTLSLLMPSPPVDMTVGRSIVVSFITLAAGAVMAVGGYAASAWSPFLVPPLLLVAGAVITCAFLIASRGSPRPGVR